MSCLYSEKLGTSLFKELHEYVYREINEKYEIFLIDIILEYVYNMMFEDVVNELKYTSILYEPPTFSNNSECIYDIVWMKNKLDHSLKPLYQLYGSNLFEKYDTLSYLYDDDLFEETYNLRKNYRNIYKAHFLIKL